LVMNPYLIQIQDDKVRVTFFVYSLMSLVVMPIIAIAILKQVKIISSFDMTSRMERIGPLIIVGILYIWMYINYKNTSSVPVMFSVFLLGSVFSVFTSFFINNFTKISLHTVGMGGFVAALFIIKFNLHYESLKLDIGDFGALQINTYFILLVIIIIAGLVGTIRLFLKSHTKDQVYFGYLVGFLSQIFAYKIIM